VRKWATARSNITNLSCGASTRDIRAMTAAVLLERFAGIVLTGAGARPSRSGGVNLYPQRAALMICGTERPQRQPRVPVCYRYILVYITIL